jgi:hypothetical protein
MKKRSKSFDYGLEIGMRTGGKIRANITLRNKRKLVQKILREKSEAVGQIDEKIAKKF